MNMDHLNEEFLWVEKYRPKTISDTILPKNLKETFQTFVDKKNVSNLILSGPAGVGKTTVAKAMLEELGCDYIVINGSLSGNIDTLRNDIAQFASSVSLQGGRKYVILDEADYLNPNSFQPALRNFMEEYSKNCGFILTCNFKDRIIEPLQSRCSTVVFNIPPDEKNALGTEFLKRLIMILKKEGIEYDTKVLAELVKKHFPDWRKILNDCQRYSITGKIDTGILANIQNTNIKRAVELMKEKDFSSLRKWVVENSDMDVTSFFRSLYDAAPTFCSTSTIPLLVLTLAKYQYQSAFVADQDINTAACLIEIMSNVEFI